MVSPDDRSASPDKLVITIEGTIDVAVARETVALLSADPLLDVRLGDCIEASSFVEIAVTLALAALVTSVVQVIIALDQRIGAKTALEKWSYDKVVELVNNKMASHEVIQFEITGIEGYSNLEEANGMPCIVFVHDKPLNNDFKIFVFMDRKSYVFKIE